MIEEKILHTPLKSQDVEKLICGDRVMLNGIIFTARDAAHKRLIQLLEKGESLPFDIKDQVIYYVGPTPEKPKEVIGSAGPTTSSRMDPYTPQLLDAGLKGMIGKGQRSKEVIEAIVRNKSIYFAATGGASVLLAKSIKKSKIIAYEDLGTEAIREMFIENFPCIVAVDSKGTNLYEKGPEKYQLL